MLIHIDKKDQKKEEKENYVSGVTRIGDLINSVQRDIEDKLLLLVSVLFSSLIGWFVSNKLYLQVFLTSGILFFLWVVTFIKESRDKEKLFIKLNYLIKEAKEKTGLDLSQPFLN